MILTGPESTQSLSSALVGSSKIGLLLCLTLFRHCEPNDISLFYLLKKQKKKAKLELDVHDIHLNQQDSFAWSVNKLNLKYTNDAFSS